MYSRIMEILVLLMDEIGAKNWQTDQMDRMSEDLIQQGYTEQEINTAFYWLYNRFGWDSSSLPYTIDVDDPAESSHRVLHTMEQKYLTPDSFGYLLQLKHLKLISSKDIEEVIERITVMDLQTVSVDDVKIIVQTMLFDDGGMGGGYLRAFESSRKGETYH